MNVHSNVRQRLSYFLVGTLVLPLCLLGCTTTDDPHQGGFISGVAGLTSGSYKKRISDREQRYQEEIVQQQRLRAEADALRLERARIETDLHQANRRLASLERKLRGERAQIARERQTTNAALQRLRRLDATEARMAEVKGKLSDAQSGASAIADLAAQSAEINEELDEIDALVEFVSSGSF